MPHLEPSDPITHLSFVGEKYAQLLLRLSIETIADLLHHYPTKYLDRSDVLLIENLVPEEKATIIGEVLDFKSIYTKNGKNLQQALVADDTGHLQLTWFNQNYLSNAIKVGNRYAFSGKTKEYRGTLTLSAPDFEQVFENKPRLHTGGLVPVYPETAGLSSKWLRSRIKTALGQVKIQEFLPTAMLTEYKLMSLQQALSYIHFPQNHEQKDQARNRLAFNELLILQASGARRRHQISALTTQNLIRVDKVKLQDFIKSLPFSLTKGQVKATREILADLGRNKPMNRLLEGDVGSGKTVVAACAMHQVYLSGFVSVLMAPTEILAKQHFDSLNLLFSKHQIKVGILTKNHKQNLDAPIIIGTVALLHQPELLKQIGLIVIDEQHRFGVNQRAKLESLSGHPHRLTMSATPIPRSVALTLYGDLDLSILDEVPKNRLTVKTWVVPEIKRRAAYNWIKTKILSRLEQVYVVCPLIDPSESDKLAEIKSATEEFEKLADVFGRSAVDILHGRLKGEAKTKVLEKFKQGSTKMLVATQVIEVGIDVANATVIIIEAAERFGLAQLHQLRGRVGRGDKQSYCLLFTSTKDKVESKRLAALTKYQSGFKLAEIDLAIRGPGEVFGLSQHGFNWLKLAKLTDKKLMMATKKAATQLVEQSSDLRQFPQIKLLVDQMESPAISTDN